MNIKMPATSTILIVHINVSTVFNFMVKVDNSFLLSKLTIINTSQAPRLEKRKNKITKIN